jgi:polyhydroxyalkanoate synthesis repressor PhaR
MSMPDTRTCRTIKKHPNRRLYDTAESRYVTLNDLYDLVTHCVDFEVIEQKSQEDITQSVLLQIVAHREQQGDPVMSRDFLSEVIRSYTDASPNLISSYLEQSLKLYAGQSDAAHGRAGVAIASIEAGTTDTQVKINYQRWRLVQDEIYRTLMRATSQLEAEDAEHPVPARNE